jgi:hypothetical protein
MDPKPSKLTREKRKRCIRDKIRRAPIWEALEDSLLRKGLMFAYETPAIKLQKRKLTDEVFNECLSKTLEKHLKKEKEEEEYRINYAKCSAAPDLLSLEPEVRILVLLNFVSTLIRMSITL